MAAMYKTPGVYVEEIAKFPPSIAPVETAIPAFIGYTERAADGKKDLTLKPTRITSLLEYISFFGTSRPERFTVDVNLDTKNGAYQVDIVKKPELQFILYHSLQAFYANGGGPCYIISVGSFFDGRVDIDSILKGLAKAKDIDEVTLLISPEAVLLNDIQYGKWATSALQQCAELQDRFTILDVSDKYKSSFDITAHFRNKISSVAGEMKYGAAYYPFVETTFSHHLEDGNGNNNISFIRIYTENGAALSATATEVTAALTAYKQLEEAENKYDIELANLSIALKEREIADKINAVIQELPSSVTDVEVIKNAIRQVVGEDAVDPTIRSAVDVETLKTSTTAFLAEKKDELAKITANRDAAKDNIDKNKADMHTASAALLAKGDYSYAQVSDVKDKNNELYNLILNKLQDSGVVLPPSSLIAGVYANVDNNRGVWKAPANVSLSNVIQPTLVISNESQKDLNIDTLSGKSINAIRSFTGKGTLVWGARTLAGNDNEWRYINVRRFFNFAEESIKKATEPFVFEPNDANTWVRVQAMIENFLTTLWRQGALQGVKPEHAFYVAIGLGKTMTALDILEGRMIIEIGMAVARPAEFIILKFSHKMAES